MEAPFVMSSNGGNASRFVLHQDMAARCCMVASVLLSICSSQR